MNPPKTRPHGGKRDGAGRPPDWLKQQCQKIVDRSKLLDLLDRIANGEESESHVTKDGDVVEIPMSGMVRLKATEMLLDRAYGKTMPSLEVPGSGNRSYRIIFETVDE